MSGVIGDCLRDVMGNWGSVKEVGDRTSLGGVSAGLANRELGKLQGGLTEASTGEEGGLSEWKLENRDGTGEGRWSGRWGKQFVRWRGGGRKF